jgi:cytoskeletal protein CcmA (bactofilin family)
MMKTPRKRWLRRLIAGFTLITLLVLGAALPARAAETRSGDTVVVGRDEVIDGDLYVAASSITIDGVIKGDLVSGASQVTVNGTVEGDILAAAQSVIINGTVDDDVRVFAQAVQVGPSAQVAGDLAVGAMSLESQAGSRVRGDVLVGAFQALIAGDVGRSILGGMERMELRGAVGGDVNVAVAGGQDDSAVRFSPAGQIPIPALEPGLTIADSARIEGQLSYQSTTEAMISPNAQIAGGISFEPITVTDPAAAPAPVQGLYAIQRLVSLLLVGMLLLWLAPLWIRRMADTVTSAPLPALGWGVVAFIAFIAAVFAVLVATVLLAILFGILTLGGLVAWVVTFGLLLSSTLVFSYITFAAYIAIGIIAFVVGRWMLQYTRPAWIERSYIPMIIGLVLYVLLSIIPWVGAVVSILVALLALGALWQWGRSQIQRQGPIPQPIGGLQTA